MRTFRLLIQCMPATTAKIVIEAEKVVKAESSGISIYLGADGVAVCTIPTEIILAEEADPVTSEL